MEITNSAENTQSFVEEHILKQLEGMVIYIPTEIRVLMDRKKSYNEDLVKAMNIPTTYLGQAGGCMIAFPGNLEIGHFSRDLQNTYYKYVENCVVRFLRDKGLNVIVAGNDVLVDGIYKVFSTSRVQCNNIMFTGIHFSITCDANLVDRICTKKMEKIPKALADYGITTDDMLELLDKINSNITIAS